MRVIARQKTARLHPTPAEIRARREAEEGGEGRKGREAETEAAVTPEVGSESANVHGRSGATQMNSRSLSKSSLNH